MRDDPDVMSQKRKSAAPRDVMGNIERHAYDASIVFGLQSKTTLLEHFQHRRIFRQNLGSQFADPGIARNQGDTPHQGPTYALSLKIVDYREGDLGCSRPHDDVTPAADDKA